MTIRRSSLAVSGSSCSSSDGKSSGCRPIQAPTYRLGGSVTLAPIWEERQTRNKAAVQSRQVRIRYNNLSSCHHISKNNANMYRSFLNHLAPRVLQEAPISMHRADMGRLSSYWWQSQPPLAHGP